MDFWRPPGRLGGRWLPRLEAVKTQNADFLLIVKKYRVTQPASRTDQILFLRSGVVAIERIFQMCGRNVGVDLCGR